MPNSKTHRDIWYAELLEEYLENDHLDASWFESELNSLWGYW